MTRHDDERDETTCRTQLEIAKSNLQLNQIRCDEMLDVAKRIQEEEVVVSQKIKTERKRKGVHYGAINEVERLYDIFTQKDEYEQIGADCVRKAFRNAMSRVKNSFWPIDETLVYMMGNEENDLSLVRFGTRDESQTFVIDEHCVLEFHSFASSSLDIDVSTNPADGSKRGFPFMDLRDMTEIELKRFGHVGNTVGRTVTDPYLYLSLGGYPIRTCGNINKSPNHSYDSTDWYKHWILPLISNDMGMRFLNLNDAIFHVTHPRNHKVSSARHLTFLDDDDESSSLNDLLSRLQKKGTIKENEQENNDHVQFQRNDKVETEFNKPNVPFEITDMMQFGSVDDSSIQQSHENINDDDDDDDDESTLLFITKQTLGSRFSRPTNQEIASTYALPSSVYDISSTLGFVFRQNNVWIQTRVTPNQIDPLSGNIQLNSNIFIKGRHNMGVLTHWKEQDLNQALRRRQDADETSRIVNVVIRNNENMFMAAEVLYPDNDALTRDAYVVRILETSSIRSVRLSEVLRVVSLDRYVSKYHVIARRVSFSERVAYETLSRAQNCVKSVHGQDPELSALWLLDSTLESWTQTCRLNMFEPSYVRVGMRREMMNSKLMKSFLHDGFKVVSGGDDDEDDEIVMVLNDLQDSIRNPFNIQIVVKLFDHYHPDLSMGLYRGERVFWMRS